MSQKYWGSINLDGIKEAISGGVTPFKGKKGQYVPVDVWVNDEPDQYGNHLSISIPNKESKAKTYVANLKKSEPRQENGNQQSNNDVPF